MIESGSAGTGIGISAGYCSLLFTVVSELLKLIWRARQEPLLPDTSMDSTLAHVHKLLIEAPYKPDTAAKYTGYVHDFLQHVGHQQLEDLRDDDVVDHLAARRAEGDGDATLRVRLCAIRAVFDRLLELRVTTGIRHAPRPRPRKHSTAAEITALMSVPADPRDKLLIDLLNRTGLRPGELRQMAWQPQTLASDAQPGAGLNVLTLETMPPETSAADWLFPSKRGNGPISTRTMRRIIQRLARACGIHATCTSIRLGPEVPLRALASTAVPA